MRTVVLIGLCVLPGCAAHTSVPARGTSTHPTVYLLSEALADDSSLCVVLDPFGAGNRFACMKVGDLRRLIRARHVAAGHP